MASPFKIQDAEERQNLWQRLTQVTRREVADADDVLGKARAFLEWNAMPYMQSYREWLTRQAMAPMPMTDPQAVMAGASRTNAFKEILEFLRVQEANARAALGE